MILDYLYLWYLIERKLTPFRYLCFLTGFKMLGTMILKKRVELEIDICFV